MFVKFEIKIFIKASRVFPFLKRETQDLNSGQLVKVDKTKNEIIQAGAFEDSAVKFTTGSKKYQAHKSKIIQSGKKYFGAFSEISSSSVFSSFCIIFLFLK